MGLYNDPYQHDPYEDRRPRRGNTLLVALVSAIIGGIVSSYVAPMYLYGRYLPYPPNYYSGSRSGGDYRIPSAPTPSTPLTENKLPQLAVVGPAEKVTPAVVGIINKVQVRDFFGTRTRTVEKGSGSGAIFDSNGYIFTNDHVVAGATELVVKLANGNMVPGQLVGSDSYMDLAVVKINPTDAGGQLPTITFGDSQSLHVGELAVAIGNPLGLDRTVTSGIISALNRAIQVDQERQMELIQTDAAINAGNSGGPLVNAAGQVIGINSIKLAVEGVEGLGFAIPSHLARPVLEDLINYGKVVRPYIGITGTVIEPGAAKQYGLSVDYGIYIKIIAGSPAQRAGLKDGDIITKIENEKITSFDQFLRLLYQKRPGDTVQVTIMRGSQEKVVPVVLMEQPSS